tara:strand:+ start:5252 stop:5800 length:549 start_codon:yes stop_codon:yes gene_type:complete
MSLHWNKVTAKERGTDWLTFCKAIEKLPTGQLWRHNQAGDLPVASWGLDISKIMALVEANEGKRGFTYTHHRITNDIDGGVIASANKNGFTINLSANSIDEVDYLVDLDIGPVVVTIPEGLPKTFQTTKGNKVVTCPATYRDDVTCASCKLCAVADRKSVVAFPFHGNKKKALNTKYAQEAK